MAENTDSFCRAVAGFIENRIRIPVQYVSNVSWQERERLFDLGEIHILWLCGLPYVDKADAAENPIELLAVPVPRGERYQGRAVYISRNSGSAIGSSVRWSSRGRTVFPWKWF
jgi:phosphonate transport system substrate-binding protein